MTRGPRPGEHHRGRTPTGEPPELDPDEELARYALIGSLAHDAIVQVLIDASRRNTSLYEGVGERWALRAADRALNALGGVEVRAHRQVVASSIFTYIQYLLPPPGWTLLGTETPLARYRVDIAWTDSEQRVLIDELKTGRLGVGLEQTQVQVRRYLTVGATKYGDKFTGVRVLCTAHPVRSWLATPDGKTAPLLRTSYLVRPWRLKRLPSYPTLAGRPVQGPRDPPPGPRALQ